MKKLEKPTAVVLKRRKELEVKDEHNELLELLNSYDWSPELFQENEKYGLKSCIGEILLPAKFHDFKTLKGMNLTTGDKVVAKLNGKYGIVRADGFGDWIIEPQFDEIGYPNAITSVYKNGKWGVLNTKKGELIIPTELDMLYGGNDFIFNNGIAYFEKEGKVGVMNEESEFTEAIFDSAEPDDSGVISVTFNGEEGFIDKDGQFTKEEDDAWFMESDPF